MAVILECEGQFQARLRTIITSGSDIEYYWQRYYFGVDEDFRDKMLDRVIYKQTELGRIAMGEDLK